MVNAASAPTMGFMFPAFDNRATNIYNALYFNCDPKDNHDDFIASVFNAPIAMPAKEQKNAFDNMLANVLEEECSMDVVQQLHQQICQQIDLHKESKVPEALTLSKETLCDILADSGVSEEKQERFIEAYSETFGEEMQVYPDNIIDKKKIEIKTPDISVRVPASQANLIQTRIIGGVKYILIQADESVEVSGINIHIS